MPLEEMQNVVLTHNISYFEIFGNLLLFWKFCSIRYLVILLPPPQKKLTRAWMTIEK
jgi:hypothetical protein